MNTINNLATYVKHFARPNQFDFVLDVPTGKLNLPSSGGDEYAKRRMFGKALSIPSVHSDIRPNFFFNKKFSSPTMIDVDNINVTFYDTTTAFFHRFYVAWLQNRYDVSTGVLKVYPADYSGTMKILIHENHVYTLQNLFPIAVSDFRLDNDMTDQFGTFDVTFFVQKTIPAKLGFSK